MMQRLRDAEHSQLVAEMRQRIAELEIKVNFFFIAIFVSEFCLRVRQHLFECVYTELTV